MRSERGNLIKYPWHVHPDNIPDPGRDRIDAPDFADRDPGFSLSLAVCRGRHAARLDQCLCLAVTDAGQPADPHLAAGRSLFPISCL